MKTIMINRYNEMSFTHEYIFMYTYKGIIYASFVDNTVLPFVTKLDKASSKNGGGYSLRFCPNGKQKKALMSYATIAVASASYFNNLVATTKYNRGEIAEMLITKYFGQQWKKDTVPFTEDGDITVNGIAYQVKFEKATFCTEQSLRNLRTRA